MIVSFKDKETEAIWNGRFTKKIKLPTKLHQIARRKLRMIYAASELNSLRIPPSNFLEELKRDRVGQHSIRINDQYRICFIWIDGNAHNVEIVDYH